MFSTSSLLFISHRPHQSVRAHYSPSFYCATLYITLTCPTGGVPHGGHIGIGHHDRGVGVRLRGSCLPCAYTRCKIVIYMSVYGLTLPSIPSLAGRLSTGYVRSTRTRLKKKLGYSRVLQAVILNIESIYYLAQLHSVRRTPHENTTRDRDRNTPCRWAGWLYRLICTRYQICPNVGESDCPANPLPAPADNSWLPSSQDTPIPPRSPLPPP